MTEEKKEVSTKDQLYLKELNPEQAKSMVALYYAVAKSNTNSLVARDIIQTMRGADQSIFNLGVRTGQNETIKQFKAVMAGSAIEKGI